MYISVQSGAVVFEKMSEICRVSFVFGGNGGIFGEFERVLAKILQPNSKKIVNCLLIKWNYVGFKSELNGF